MIELEPYHNCRLARVERARRKLFFRPARRATEYFGYCEEFGCGWETELNALPGRLDTAAILTLPPGLTPAGFTSCAAGVELPCDTSLRPPPGYLAIELEPVVMLYFAGPDFATAFHARDTYRPERDRLEFAPGLAPAFNFGSDPEVRLAIPVKFTT
ncbi:MAG: hypothetical protein AB7F32_11220 [Victivallaceae bacterium]